jgi:hypothetical protein
MKPEEKKEWTGALRGDEYKQSRHCLNDLFGNCCLGVKADLEAKKGRGRWEPSSDPSKPDRMDFVIEYPDGSGLERQAGLLPSAFALDTFGSVDNCSGILPFYPRMFDREDFEHDPGLDPNATSATSCDLADLNDSGLTFAQIADVIDHFF